MSLKKNDAPTIGIVGQGFVGSAIREGLRNYYELSTFDIAKKEDFAANSLEDLVERSSIIFVCLPTPMRKSGECDTRILRKAILEIDSICESRGWKEKIGVVKSTVPPGTTRSLDEETKSLTVIFSPEFLTEANAMNDFKNQNRIILGGSRPATSIVKSMFSKAFPRADIIKTGSKTAEMVKYFINCFLATKVSFANEIKQICDSQEIDYDKVVEYALYDMRLGRSHFSCPGPDGSSGFGGHCFPKDLNAMMYIALKEGIEPQVMAGVWAKNLEVRESALRDWEAMSGRAVSED